VSEAVAKAKDNSENQRAERLFLFARPADARASRIFIIPHRLAICQ